MFWDIQYWHGLFLSHTATIISHVCSCKWSCGYQKIYTRDKFRCFQYLLISSTESDFSRHPHNILQSALISLLGFHLNIAWTILLTVVCMNNYSQQILLWLKEIWVQNYSKLLYLQVVYQFLLCINWGNPLRPVLPLGEMGFRYFANMKNSQNLNKLGSSRRIFF